jgi:hypothetical protein
MRVFYDRWKKYIVIEGEGVFIRKSLECVNNNGRIEIRKRFGECIMWVKEGDIKDINGETVSDTQEYLNKQFNR